MADREIHLIEERPRTMSVIVFVAVSLFFHALLIVFWMIRNPMPVREAVKQIRYIEVAKSIPIIEGKGAPVEKKVSPEAPLSNANREARSPNPSGERPTRRPGGPMSQEPQGGPQQQQSRPVQQASQSPAAAEPPQPVEPQPRSAMEYRVNRASASTPVDWKAAITQISRAAAAGGQASDAGEEGFAESGPVSFESQWYEWGDYGDAMVRKIRIHWHANMPAILRMGVKGAVTIRFTIQRSGDITDIQILRSSGVPPYDNAARKAIQLASPLAPLPADFPNNSERVTAKFYYNMRIDERE